MTPIERIDRYLSHQLRADEVVDLERDLRADTDLQRLLDSVAITRRTVRALAIRDEVRRVHGAFVRDYRLLTPADAATETDEPDGRVTPLPRRSGGGIRPVGWVMRAVAAVLLVVGGYVGYQVATLDPRALYAEKFVAYQLPIARGANATRSALDSLYRAGNYAAVVNHGTAVPRSQQVQAHFLTAMARLQLGQYDAALTQFQALRAVNRRSDTPLFEQEADYYEALAALGAGGYERAHAGFKRIYDDSRHLFHGNVAQTDLWKLRLLINR